MRRTSLLSFFFAPLVLPLALNAQYASIELSEEDIAHLGAHSKTATLQVVISNEKDPKDAALVSAVKKYWKAGPYKFLSSQEFFNIKTKNDFSENYIYLYEWYDGEVFFQGSNAELAAFNKISTGIYFLSSGKTRQSGSSSSYRRNQSPHVTLRFDMSSARTNSKDRVVEGYYDLMIKYFSHELEFCKGDKALANLKKETKGTLVYFNGGESDIQKNDILLIKEQVVRQQPVKKSGRGGSKKKSSPMSVVSHFNPPDKNIYTVFPEDVKMAVSKGDAKVMLYCSDMLISAQNGQVIAAPARYGETKKKSDLPFWAAVIGVFISALSVAFALQ